MPREKKPWDTALEGTSPLLDVIDFNNKKAEPVTDEAEIQAERIRRAGVQASELSHSSMRTGWATFLSQAQTHEAAYKLNVEQFPVLAPDLARALYVQGKFDEALEYATGDLADYITRLKEAVEKDDDFDCECKREVVDGVELNRHFEKEFIFSPKHDKVVSVKECSKCGDLNVYDGLPERQNRLANLRAKAPQADDIALLKLL